MARSVRVLRGSRWRTASECSEAPGCSACSDLTGLRVLGAALACRVFAVFANCCKGACLGVRGAGNECLPHSRGALKGLRAATLEIS